MFAQSPFPNNFSSPVSGFGGGGFPGMSGMPNTGGVPGMGGMNGADPFAGSMAMMTQMLGMMQMVMMTQLMKMLTQSVASMSSGNPNFGGGTGVSGPGTGNFLGTGSTSGGSSTGATGTATAPNPGKIEGGGQGEAAVKWALSQEGISESKNPDVVRSYSKGRWEAWCAHFVSTSLEKTGGSPFGHQASVAGILAWGKQNKGHFISSSDAKANPGRLKVGDVVVWKQAGKSHVGLLTAVNSDGTFSTIEGNTSDKVAQRKHKFSDPGLTGFVRPRGTY